jgi:hypothetical protein
MENAAPPSRPSIRDLIRKSDFARLNPSRVDELLDRSADPLLEDRNDTEARSHDDG